VGPHKQTTINNFYLEKIEILIVTKFFVISCEKFGQFNKSPTMKYVFGPFDLHQALNNVFLDLCTWVWNMHSSISLMNNFWNFKRDWICIKLEDENLSSNIYYDKQCFLCCNYNQPNSCNLMHYRNLMHLYQSNN